VTARMCCAVVRQPANHVQNQELENPGKRLLGNLSTSRPTAELTEGQQSNVMTRPVQNLW
jgi:hypothetical protein